MTYKWAAAGFPRGGGKAVLAVPPGSPRTRRDGLLRRYGAFIQELGGTFLDGRRRRHLAARHGRDRRDRRAVRLQPDARARRSGRFLGAGRRSASRPDPEDDLRAALRRRASLSGRRIVVQGAGSVGGALIERLLAAGAVDRVQRRRRGFGAAPSRRSGLDFVEPGGVLETPATCSRRARSAGVLDAETIPRLSAGRSPAPPTTSSARPEDAERLRDARASSMRPTS